MRFVLWRPELLGLKALRPAALTIPVAQLSPCQFPGLPTARETNCVPRDRLDSIEDGLDEGRRVLPGQNHGPPEPTRAIVGTSKAPRNSIPVYLDMCHNIPSVLSYMDISQECGIQKTGPWWFGSNGSQLQALVSCAQEARSPRGGGEKAKVCGRAWLQPPPCNSNSSHIKDPHIKSRTELQLQY